MPKPRIFYPLHQFLQRPAKPAFRCSQCGFLSSAGAAPVCQACRQGAAVERCEGEAHPAWLRRRLAGKTQPHEEMALDE